VSYRIAFIELLLASASFALPSEIVHGLLVSSVRINEPQLYIVCKRIISILGGAAGNEGLGMFALCFDWNYVGSGGGSMGALFTPLSTQLSLYFGTAICM